MSKHNVNRLVKGQIDTSVESTIFQLFGQIKMVNPNPYLADTSVESTIFQLFGQIQMVNPNPKCIQVGVVRPWELMQHEMHG